MVPDAAVSGPFDKLRNRYCHPSNLIGWRRISGMPNNSLSRAVHALLIAPPTVAATGELVSERSRPLPSPCLLWRKHRWGGVSVTQSESVHQGNRYKAHLRCCWCDLCACCSNINTLNEKLNQHISPASNQTYINILHTALTSLRTGVLRVKGAVDISQCLSCKVHLQSVWN